MRLRSPLAFALLSSCWIAASARALPREPAPVPRPTGPEVPPSQAGGSDALLDADAITPPALVNAATAVYPAA
ncbi:MAG: hypothetical protein ACHQ53_08070, partial [Polyangiales bacterium]